MAKNHSAAQVLSAAYGESPVSISECPVCKENLVTPHGEVPECERCNLLPLNFHRPFPGDARANS